MIYDLMGSSGFIDSYASGTPWAPPPQIDIAKFLTNAGKSVWQATQQKYNDVIHSVSKIIGVRQMMMSEGSYRNDDCVYGIYDFSAVLDAGMLMQDYIMAHPQAISNYHRGIDIYPKFELKPESRAIYHRAIDSIVQFTDDCEYVTHVWDSGFDDLHSPTFNDKCTLNQTYKYLEENVFNNLKALMFDQLTEEAS